MCTIALWQNQRTVVLLTKACLPTSTFLMCFLITATNCQAKANWTLPLPKLLSSATWAGGGASLVSLAYHISHCSTRILFSVGQQKRLFILSFSNFRQRISFWRQERCEQSRGTLSQQRMKAFILIDSFWGPIKEFWDQQGSFDEIVNLNN